MRNSKSAADRGYPIIDAHCHVFNASDLSVSGFLRKVILDTDEGRGLKDKVLDALVKFLAGLIRKAPGADDEHKWLDKRERDGSRYLSYRSPAPPEDIEAEGQTNREFLADVEAGIDQLALSADPGDQELLNMILAESGGDIAANRHLTISATGTNQLARNLLLIGGTISRLTRWVQLLKQYRWEILAKLIRAFGRDGEVDLFTPSIVDFQHWLDDPPDTRLPAQYVLMSRIVRLVAPRMHPLAAFDPWRESLHPNGEDGSLLWAQRAVNELGFVGVKIYPPMGFAPAGNINLDFSKVGQSNSRAFGQRLDNAMNSLFTWAESEGVPIMAHASDSIESKDDFGLRAGPKYWAEALKSYPKLRVNFAHFGGEGTVAVPGGWAEEFATLISSHDNAYGDIGHFDDVLTKHGAVLLDSLAALIDRFPRLEDRLLFGSDWSMLARVKDADEYYEKVIQGLKQRLSTAVVEKIMGKNAASYFGLTSGGANRTRLQAFYRKEELPLPYWLSD